MSNDRWDYISKFVLIGDASVGKSSLLVRLTDNRFLADSEPTIGVEFGSQVIELENGERIKVQVWDTAGSESFRSITRSYYRGAAGALLVYSIAHRESFDHVKGWLEDVRKHAEEDVSIVLVGNMSDLAGDGDEETGEGAGESTEAQDVRGAEDSTAELSNQESEASESPAPKASAKKEGKRKVSKEEAEAFAKKEGLMFVETSAKTGDNVEEAFARAARSIHAKFLERLAEQKASQKASGGNNTGTIGIGKGGRVSGVAAAHGSRTASGSGSSLETRVARENTPKDAKSCCVIA